jgi:hypothetical protein
MTLTHVDVGVDVESLLTRALAGQIERFTPTTVPSSPTGGAS